MYTQAMEDEVTSATQLPYFEGDFWPSAIEDSIREIQQEEEERKKTEAQQAAALEAAAAAAVSSENPEESMGEETVSGSSVSRSALPYSQIYMHSTP